MTGVRITGNNYTMDSEDGKVTLERKGQKLVLVRYGDYLQGWTAADAYLAGFMKGRDIENSIYTDAEKAGIDAKKFVWK